MKPLFAWMLAFMISPSTNGNPCIIPSDTARKPSVTLQDTLMDPMLILMIRDTAACHDDLGRAFSKDYGELFTYIGQNDLRPGKLLAQYYTFKSAFIFDVAVQIDRLPTTTKGRIKINRINGGNVVIAHYIGPYDQIGMAYSALDYWLEKNDKAAGGLPFEVYLNDPVTVQDPYDLRTDIYQLLIDIPHSTH